MWVTQPRVHAMYQCVAVQHRVLHWLGGARELAMQMGVLRAHVEYQWEGLQFWRELRIVWSHPSQVQLQWYQTGEEESVWPVVLVKAIVKREEQPMIRPHMCHAGDRIGVGIGKDNQKQESKGMSGMEQRGIEGNGSEGYPGGGGG